MLRRSVRLLAELTRQVAVIQYPVLSTATVRHVELVALTPSRLLLVVITDGGRVEQRMVALSRDVSDDDVVTLRDIFAGALDGEAARRRVSGRRRRRQCRSDTISDIVLAIAAVLVETLVEREADRLVLGGTSNLARAAADFSPTAGHGLGAGSTRGTSRGAQAVDTDAAHRRRHRADRSRDEVRTICGVHRWSRPRTVPAEPFFGSVGVLGPTRMDYPNTIASVAAVAKYVGEVLAER